MVADEVERVLSAIDAGAVPAEIESETLDFKTQGRSVPDTLKDLAEAAVCFANGRGGVLVVGVADRVAGPAALQGTTLEPAPTQRRIYELTEPPLIVTTELVRHRGTDLLVIRVPSSPEVHAVGGRSTERLGTTCRRMSPSRIATVVAERRGDDWSAHDSGVPISRADPLALASARSLLALSADPRRRAYGRETDEDLLRALGLISPDGTLVRGGALLFTGSTQEHVAYVHRRTPAGGLVVNEHLSGPALVAVLRTLELISARVDRTSVNLPGGQQLQVADLPEVAVREAVINAVMHRDHRGLGPIQVDHTATRLAVTSPGPFVNGVTVHNVLTTSSRSRNPLLSSAVRALGLAETAGSGVDRMYAEMARLGHQPPAFDADLDRVRVTLLGGAPNAHLARFIATLPPGEAEDADTMLVLLTLLTRRVVSVRVMAPLLQKPEAETVAVLNRLSAEPVGLIEPTRESASFVAPDFRLREHAVAALGAALSYRRRTTDEYDRKVVGMIGEVGEVNARMVRILLDLEVTPASRVLGDLVERGVLAKTSKAQRGPGVTYGPGPRFPAASRRGGDRRSGRGAS